MVAHGASGTSKIRNNDLDCDSRGLPIRAARRSSADLARITEPCGAQLFPLVILHQDQKSIRLARLVRLFGRKDAAADIDQQLLTIVHRDAVETTQEEEQPECLIWQPMLDLLHPELCDRWHSEPITHLRCLAPIG